MFKFINCIDQIIQFRLIKEDNQISNFEGEKNNKINSKDRFRGEVEALGCFI